MTLFPFFSKKIGKLGIIVEKVGSSKKLAKSDGMELEKQTS